MAEDDVKSCEECGASVYPEHIGAGKAGLWGGKLYCIHCYTQHRGEQVTIDPGDFGEAAANPGSELDDLVDALDDEFDDAPINEPAVAAAETDPAAAPEENDDGSIKLVAPAGPELSSFAPARIAPFGGSKSSAEEEVRYRRPLQHAGGGATRCKIYHAKLNDGAMKFLQDQINEWIDSHPDVEIKHASTQVGIVEGKSQEPHLIITVFY